MNTFSHLLAFFINKDLNKIQQVTKEASENIRWSYKSKYRGISKEGYEVEFFSDVEGIINTSYLYTDNLKLIK